jgi:uncharacterized surface protein with fasciclin (FAS1) repeats
MKRLNRSLIATAAVIALSAACIPSIASARPPAREPRIVDIALSVNADSGEFSTLIAALTYTSLVRTLSRKGQYTVFAPTDAAFAELGLDPDNVVMLPEDALKNILLYHVAPGRRDSSDVLGANRIIMLNGNFSFPSVDDDGAFINDVQLLAPDPIDIEASKGIIHVIDTVLILQ